MKKIILFFLILSNFSNAEVLGERTFNLNGQFQTFDFFPSKEVINEFEFQSDVKPPVTFLLNTNGRLKYIVNFENEKINFKKKRFIPVRIAKVKKDFIKKDQIKIRVKYKNLKLYAKAWPSEEKEPAEWDLGFIFKKDPWLKNISTDYKESGQVKLIGKTGSPFGDQRGRYFPKKNLVTSTIPSFSKLKEKLPEPVIGNPDLVRMYWKSMEIAASHIKNPEENSGLVSTFLDEAFRPNIFQWDTIFMMFFTNYFYPHISLISSLDNFYARQHDDGMIWREIQEKDGGDSPLVKRNFINPPLFAWAEWNFYRTSMDKERLQMVLPSIENYMDWLEIYMKAQFTVHRLYWNNPLGSGMDNIPVKTSNSHGWVDMSSQMVLSYRSLSKICAELGLSEKSSHYLQMAQSISDRINKWMWNEETGMYSDLDQYGRKQNVAQIGTFWPMIAEVASKAQIEKMIKHLKDPNLFNTDFPFPALAKNHPKFQYDGGYWRGGVWAPTNFMTLKGLEVNGFPDEARLFSQKYLDGLLDVFNHTGTIWEMYAPMKDSQGKFYPGSHRGDFVGWTGLGPITLLFENIIGITLDPINKKIVWDLNRIDLHGIKNLSVGNNTLSLISNPRNSRDKYSLEIDATKCADAIDLVINNHGKKREVTLIPRVMNFVKSVDLN